MCSPVSRPINLNGRKNCNGRYASSNPRMTYCARPPLFRPRGSRPQTEAMADFIDQYHDVRGIEPICKEPPIAPSPHHHYKIRAQYPQRRSARVKCDEQLAPEISVSRRRAIAMTARAKCGGSSSENRCPQHAVGLSG